MLRLEASLTKCSKGSYCKINKKELFLRKTKEKGTKPIS